MINIPVYTYTIYKYSISVPRLQPKKAGGYIILYIFLLLGNVAVFQPLDKKVYELDVSVGKTVGADGGTVAQTEQIVGGYIKYLRELHERLRRRHRDPHLPGVYTRACDSEHFGELRLCITLLFAELFYPLVNHSCTSWPLLQMDMLYSKVTKKIFHYHFD